MRTLRTIASLLTIIGALNWLLVGLFGFDLVAAITGNDFGEKDTTATVIYVIVGLAGLTLLPSLFDATPPLRDDPRDGVRSDARADRRNGPRGL